MLEGEVAIAKDFSSTDISEANYSFRFVRDEAVDGHGCYVLECSLIAVKITSRGYVWVDANTYLLLQLRWFATNPSWWLRNVHVDSYGRCRRNVIQTQSADPQLSSARQSR